MQLLSCAGAAPHGVVLGVTAQLAETAKRGCPISHALASVPSITLSAKLDA